MTQQPLTQRTLGGVVLFANNHHSRRIDPYSDEWYTPDKYPQALGGFDLDPCAGPKSHARRNVRRPRCGLAMTWTGRVWLNPPYSNIHLWLAKFSEHGNGIALVNVRPETQWFQRFAANADSILWLRGRIRFEKEGASGQPPVGSALIAYGKRNARALQKCKLPGLLTSVIPA